MQQIACQPVLLVEDVIPQSAAPSSVLGNLRISAATQCTPCVLCAVLKHASGLAKGMGFSALNSEKSRYIGAALGGSWPFSTRSFGFTSVEVSLYWEQTPCLEAI